MDATKNLTTFANQVDEHRLKIKEHENTIDLLNQRNVELEQLMMDMEKESQEREFELQEFGKQLERRALVWKQMLEEKNERLDSLRIKYDEILSVNPGYDIDADRVEMRRLSEVIGLGSDKSKFCYRFSFRQSKNETLSFPTLKQN